MDIKESKLYTVKELEKILGLERRIIYKLIATERLHGVKTNFKEKKRVLGKYLLEYLK